MLDSPPNQPELSLDLPLTTLANMMVPTMSRTMKARIKTPTVVRSMPATVRATLSKRGNSLFNSSSKITILSIGLSRDYVQNYFLWRCLLLNVSCVGESLYAVDLTFNKVSINANQEEISLEIFLNQSLFYKARNVI